jgi:hypothetical protein
VSIATSYRLYCPGFEYRQGQEVLSSPKLSRPAVGPHQLPIQWIPGFFPAGKEAGALS